MFEKRNIILGFITFFTIGIITFLTILLIEKEIINRHYINALPFIIVLIVIIYFISYVKYERSKKFKNEIEEILSKMGYQFISERPLNFREFMNTGSIEPTIMVNGISINQLKNISTNYRIITVKENKNKKLYELQIEIIKTWKKEFKIIVKRKKRKTNE